MRGIKKCKFYVALAMLAMVSMITTPTTALAYANSVTYSGQGLIADGFGGYDLVTEICAVVDANGNIIPDSNGKVADAKGPYLLWVLTAPSASNADITGPWGTATMTKFGNGTFKYISEWYSPDTLPGNVTATYDGRARNAQLTISHGCRPYTHGAWCSPGFWKNANLGAWELIGYTGEELFNATVVPLFYQTPSGFDPTLLQVLNYTGPGGANHFGGADNPYGLNAFNATGAFLTNNIPGFSFDPTFVKDDDSQTCPIDHSGNFKQP